MSDALPPETLRLFIALTVPEDVKTEIEKAQAALRRALPEGRVRWTKREQLHLTLKFLGDVHEREIMEVCRAVEQGAAKIMGPFLCPAGRNEHFPGSFAQRDQIFNPVIGLSVIKKAKNIP